MHVTCLLFLITVEQTFALFKHIHLFLHHPSLQEFGRKRGKTEERENKPTK